MMMMIYYLMNIYEIMLGNDSVVSEGLKGRGPAVPGRLGNTALFDMLVGGTSTHLLGSDTNVRLFE